MSSRSRWATTLSALVLPAWLLWRLGAAPAGALPPAELLPASVSSWRAAEDRQLDPAALGAGAPDDYRLRAFRAAEGAPIWAYAAWYAGEPGRNAHDPALCYPAQGWQVLSEREVQLPAPDGERVHARLLEVGKGQRREAVLYWFQPAGRWAVSGVLGELLRIADVLAGRPQFAFVRLSRPLGDDAAADAPLLHFADALIPLVRRAVEPAAGARSTATPTRT